MKGHLRPKFGRLRELFNQWGGTTATFFTFTHLSHDQCAGLLVALLPLIRADLGLNYLQSGLLLSAFSITAGVSQFLGGWLGDRVKRYILIAIGLSGVGLATLAVGFSSTFIPMLAILIVLGFFAGAYHPSATSLLSGCFEKARMGRVLAVHMLGGSLGFTLGPLLGGLIAGMMGWRFAYILLSIPVLLVVPLVLKKFRQWEHISSSEPMSDVPSTDNTSTEAMPGRLKLLQVLRPIAIITALAVLTQFVAGSAMAFIPIYLVNKFDVNLAYAAILTGVIRSGGLPGSLLGGWLSDRWGRKNAIFLVLIATGPILYLLTSLSFNWVLVVVFVMLGLFMQMRQSTVVPFLMDSTPSYLRATVFGIYFGLSMEGQSLLQPAVGYLMDIFGVVDIFRVIAFVSIALSLVTLLLIKRVKSH